MAGVGRLRQRDRESQGESSGAPDEQGATRGLIFRYIPVLHTIVLSRLVRELWAPLTGVPRAALERL
jgi:hypothetical protein